MKTKRVDIYVGLGNQNKDKDIETIDSFKSKLAKHFKKYEVDFSIADQLGGYVREDGSYIVEDSLRITLVGDTKEEDLNEFIDFIKKEYNQETIMVDIVDLDVKLM